MMILLLLLVLCLVGLWAINRLLPAFAAALLLKLMRRLSGVRSRWAKFDGLSMVYSEGGKGETLLLLHGLGADRSSFEAVAGLLTPHYHLVIPDLPGFGDSSAAADGDYGIDKQVERVDRFVTSLGLTSFHLGGNSMGGWIASAYAAKFPDKVKSLWLIAAAGTEEMLDTDAVKLRQETGVYTLLAQNMPEYKAVLRRICVRVPPMPYCALWLGSQRAAKHFATHAKLFDQLLLRGEEYKLEPLLPQVIAPTLLMWGEQDRIVPVAVMHCFHRLLPNSEVVLLPNIGHVPQAEAPKRVVADYLRFRHGLALARAKG